MKPIYCSESQDRIPPEFFKAGKAVWSGGRAYLKEHADRLKLKIDPAPPPKYAWLTSYDPNQPPPVSTVLMPAPVGIIAKPHSPAHAALSAALAYESGPASASQAEPPGAGSTIHGMTTPIKDPLVASTLGPFSSPFAAGGNDAKAAGPAQEKAKPGAQKKTDIHPPRNKKSGLHPKPEAPRPIFGPPGGAKTDVPKPAVNEGAAGGAPAPLEETLVSLTPAAKAELEKAAKAPIVSVPNVKPEVKTGLPKVAQTSGSGGLSAQGTPKPAPSVEAPISAAPPAKVEIAKDASPPMGVATAEASKEKMEAPKVKAVESTGAAKTTAPQTVSAEKMQPPAPTEVAKAVAPIAAVSEKPAPPAVKPAVPAAAKAVAPAAVKPAAPAAAKPAAAASPAKPGAPATPGAAGAPAKKEAPRVLAEITLGYGEPIFADELMKLPIFEGIPASQIERLPGAIVKRTFKPGEIVCREGQYGSTAFYILSGNADVYLNTPITHVKSDKKESSRGFMGIIRKFKTRLVGRKEDPREGESKSQYIPNDGPVDLPMNNPIAEMHPGDLFGEMSCMSFYPRSATVRAKGEVVMLEMLRNVLQVLQKNKKFKEQIDKSYRERALGQHLRSVPILKDYVDDKVIDQLRYRVELLEFDPGETIIKQGDPSDAFYLIRVGCVKVSQTHPGGEIVLTYLGRGEYFGEIGLLKNIPRTATCTALDHVEIVKIKKADFDFILSTYDELNEKLLVAANERTKATQHMSEHAPAMPLDDFLGQGLMQAQNLLLLDLEKCTRCDECVRACADSHQGVTRLVREGLRFDKFLVPTSCRSCMDPVCMIGCPVGSIRRKDSMEIIIEDWCIGCELCAKQCPYGNISMHPFDVQLPDPENPAMKKAGVKEKAVTCDLCTELQEPSCVYACPHDAAHRVNAREFFITGVAK